MKTTSQRSDTHAEASKQRNVVETQPVSRSVQSQPSALTKATEIPQRKVPIQAITQETVHLQTPLVQELETVNKTDETKPVATVSTSIEEALLDTSPPITRPTQVVESGNPVVTQQMVQESPDSSVVEREVVTESTAKAESVAIASSVEVAAVQTQQIAKSVTGGSVSAQELIQSDAMVSQFHPLVTQSPANEAVPAQPSLHASVKHAPVRSMPATRADYGWLRDALLSRIERLKGYPYVARTNRWEGLVILEAVINYEGELVDLKIAESSGHSVLDQDAMEVIRKSCPLRLKHPLGKSEMTMRVPISYKLR
jgi:protein TonB